MSGQLLKILQEREMSLSGSHQCLSGSLPLTRIPLTKVLDREQQLVTHGHVLLGFAPQGHYVISYQCQLEPSVSLTSYHYTLYWWTFDPPKPLVCFYKQKLFAGHKIQQELHLLVCESMEEDRVTIVGRQLAGDQHDHHPCYVTVVLSPPFLPTHTPHDVISIHIGYDLLPPFPSFIPSLCLKLPACVLVNSGCSLVAVCVDQGKRSYNPSSPLRIEQHSSTLVQKFTTGVAGEQVDEAAVLSPGHMLPVEVYCGEQALTEVTGGDHEQAEGEMVVTVSQHYLDLEQWLCQTLPYHLARHQLNFHCLTDYDLQLVEVCRMAWDVIFVVIVIVEAFSSDEIATGCSDRFSLELLGCWNLCSEKTEVILFQNLHAFPLTISCSSQRRWNPAHTLAINLRQQFHLPKSAGHKVRSLSNHTVFSGKSLQSLRHPVLPIALVRKSCTI